MRSWGQSHATNVVVDRDLDRKNIIVCNGVFLGPSHVFYRRGRNKLVIATMNVMRDTGSGVGNIVSNSSFRIRDLRPSKLELRDNKRLSIFFQNLVNCDDFVVFIL